jgi:hypothetical protein
MDKTGVAEATRVIDSLRADGQTNMEAGIISALRLLDIHGTLSPNIKPPAHLLVFSDGEINKGMTKIEDLHNTIVDTIKAIERKVHISFFGFSKVAPANVMISLHKKFDKEMPFMYVDDDQIASIRDVIPQWFAAKVLQPFPEVHVNVIAKPVITFKPNPKTKGPLKVDDTQIKEYIFESYELSCSIK